MYCLFFFLWLHLSDICHKGNFWQDEKQNWQARCIRICFSNAWTDFFWQIHSIQLTVWARITRCQFILHTFGTERATMRMLKATWGDKDNLVDTVNACCFARLQASPSNNQQRCCSVTYQTCRWWLDLAMPERFLPSLPLSLCVVLKEPSVPVSLTVVLKQPGLPVSLSLVLKQRLSLGDCPLLLKQRRSLCRCPWCWNNTFLLCHYPRCWNSSASGSFLSDPTESGLLILSDYCQCSNKCK